MSTPSTFPENLHPVPPKGDATERTIASTHVPDSLDLAHTPAPPSFFAPAGRDCGEGAREAALSIEGYDIVAQLGEGGMGVVYRARQLSLNRLVALKMIAADFFFSAEARQRFRREAEAVARFQHPHIVQIYDINDQCVRPYFTMELVGGGSLFERLRQGPLPPREAAGLLLVLARTMARVHEHGILHRDLKPQNVLLTTDGSPKITDFGLARTMDLGSDSEKSRHLAGTPSYMAPEQTGDQRYALGPATDVYGLGATLYHTLTGRPPFVGPSAVETIGQVCNDEPIPPQRLQPGIPRDLNTICLKCLAKDPARRYASAADLAADLQAFLEGRPIQARPTPWWERAVKWVRRRPAIAAALLVAFVAVVIVAGLAWSHYRALEQHARELQEEVARTAAEKQRADANSERGWQAVKRFRTITDHPELRKPELKKLRTALWQVALDYYEQLAAQPFSDQRSQRELAVAFFELANTTGEVSSLARAVAIFEKTEELLQAYLLEYPDDHVMRTILSMATTNLGNLYRRVGEEERGAAAYQRAIRLQEELLRGELAANLRDSVREFLAQSHVLLGNYYSDTGNPEQARREYETSVTMREALLDERPGDPDLERAIAVVMMNLGNLARLQPDPAQAESYYQQALKTYERLLKSQVDAQDIRGAHALVLHNLSSYYVTAGQPEQGLEYARRAEQERKTILASDPGSLEAQTELASSHRGVGDALRLLRRDAEAEQAYQAALQIQDRLTAEHPEVIEHALERAITQGGMGLLLAGQEKLPAALGRLDEAISGLDGILRREPKHPVTRLQLALFLNGRAAVLEALGRSVPAMQDRQRAESLRPVAVSPSGKGG